MPRKGALLLKNLVRINIVAKKVTKRDGIITLVRRSGLNFDCAAKNFQKNHLTQPYMISFLKLGQSIKRNVEIRRKFSEDT